jgi:hypothetical protein
MFIVKVEGSSFVTNALEKIFHCQGTHINKFVNKLHSKSHDGSTYD